MRGTYTLVVICRKSFRTRLGKLGYVNVGEGHYLYTGSALGEGSVSLEGRLTHHLRASKKRRWHIDYLTSTPKCAIRAAVFLRVSERLECSVNQAITNRLPVKPILPRAGSSDCHCEGHLLKVESARSEKEVVRLLIDLYRGFGKSILGYPDVVARSAGLLPIYSEKRRGRF